MKKKAREGKGREKRRKKGNRKEKIGGRQKKRKGRHRKGSLQSQKKRKGRELKREEALTLSGSSTLILAATSLKLLSSL